MGGSSSYAPPFQTTLALTLRISTQRVRAIRCVPKAVHLAQPPGGRHPPSERVDLSAAIQVCSVCSTRNRAVSNDAHDDAPPPRASAHAASSRTLCEPTAGRSDEAARGRGRAGSVLVRSSPLSSDRHTKDTGPQPPLAARPADKPAPLLPTTHVGRDYDHVALPLHPVAPSPCTACFAIAVPRFALWL